MKDARLLLGLPLAVLALALPAGCPTATNPVEFIAGGTGDNPQLGLNSEITVLSPNTDLAITGGTPIEVNWQAIATTNFAVVDVLFDIDTNPDNDNELSAVSNLTLGTSTATLGTIDLDADTYFILVQLREQNEVVATDYAPGSLIVNQATRLFFSEPRTNVSYDRSMLITPTIDVSWQSFDPDSTISIEFFLDPDESTNGNEIPLRTSNMQDGDSFQFSFNTANFDPGTYRVLALVSDGVEEFPFYSPGAITLRARLAGVIDLRELDDPTSGIAGAIFEGFNPRDNAGSFVDTMTDLDGDGFAEFLIMAQFGKPRFSVNLQRTGVGEAYMVFGRADRFRGRINLNSTGQLFRGNIWEGAPEATNPIRPSRGITSFTAIDDLDGDGVRELVFGLPFTDSLSIGAPLDPPGYFRTGAVVVASSTALRPDLGFPGGQAFSLAEFGTLSTECCQNPACPHTFVGPKSPSATNDVTYFYRYGPPNPGPGTAVNPGTVRMGCRFSSVGFGDQFGETVSDWQQGSFIISAPNRDPFDNIVSNTQNVPGGGVVSVYGGTFGLDGFVPWGNVGAPDGAPSTLVDQLPHGGSFHYILDDKRILASGDPFSPGYVVDFDNGTPCNMLFTPRTGTGAFTTRFWSNANDARVGNAVGVGDLNADGYPDILIGAPFTSEGAGACYIIFGRQPELFRGSELELEELGLPLNGPDEPNNTRVFEGLRVVGSPENRLGQSQDNAGDFNGDGLPDVAIGSPLLNNRRGGVAVFFGDRDVINLTQEDIPLEEIPARGLGVIFEGVNEGDLAGARVRSAGDLDGDGNTDLLIAAPGASVRLDTDLDGVFEIDRTTCGVVYVVYGDPALAGRTASLADVGTVELPGAIFVGRESGHQLGAGVGELGDRATGIASAGDVDGDGLIDLLMSSIIASPRDRVRAGETYLIYGVGN